MPGVDPQVICHRLAADPKYKPVRQKKRTFAYEKAIAIKAEVEKLLKANFIREVHYPEWLSNVVLVKKSNGKWRMCVDFTDLNKACPKDSYPLPHIDSLVDSTAGHGMLSFMDAFSGYNQIKMHPEDEEKTSFITDIGTFCYKVMPFGLINAGATFQRLVDLAFKDLLGNTMEAYVDDLLVKSKNREDHPRHLQEAFDIMRTFKIRLNPEKCSFGVSSGKFLGYVVTPHGVEPNPDKVKAVMEMPIPKNITEVQRLNGRITALGRFISRSGDRCKVFFDLLKKKKDLIWTEECQVAFDQLKLFLTQPPIMSIPKRGEPLYLYLAVSDCAISSVLIREELKIQHPVFYFSKTLRDSELRYSTLEKLAYALLLSSKRLRPYFQGHPIHVLTNAPLGLVMKDPGATGRVAKWAMKLKEFDIYYAPRPAIKAQVLADFIVEMSTPLEDPKLASDSQVGPGVKLWNLHTDGSSNSAGNGAGIVLTSPDGAKLEYSLKLLFPATNNVAEYEALIAGVRIARSLGAEVLKAHTDSELVANQINGEYEARDETMSAYLAKVKQITSTMGHFEVTHIPRNLNHMADALARLASAAEDDSFAGTILREELRHPSTEEDEVNLVEEPQDNWMSAIRRFLIEGTLPEDKKKAEALKRRSTRFILINSQLYRKGFTTPLLKCLGPEAAAQVLQEIHEGTCSSHVGPRTLAQKVFRQGYWWPSVMTDAEAYVLSLQSVKNLPG